MRTPIKTRRAPMPGGGYSQGVRVAPFIFVAGQTPIDPATGLVDGATIEDQTRRALANVEAVLEASDSSLRDVVRFGVFLADLGDFEAYDVAFRSIVGEPFPARTTVGARLVGVKIEIDAIAFIEGDR